VPLFALLVLVAALVKGSVAAPVGIAVGPKVGTSSSPLDSLQSFPEQPSPALIVWTQQLSPAYPAPLMKQLC